MESSIEYAKVLKSLGSSRFMVKRLSGEEIETHLKGSMRSKSQKKIEINDWVVIEDLGLNVSGSNHKIVERIGSDKDKQVKDLKKQGQLEFVVQKEEITNEYIEEKSEEEEDFGEDFINDL